MHRQWLGQPVGWQPLVVCIVNMLVRHLLMCIVSGLASLWVGSHLFHSCVPCKHAVLQSSHVHPNRNTEFLKELWRLLSEITKTNPNPNTVGNHKNKSESEYCRKSQKQIRIRIVPNPNRI